MLEEYLQDQSALYLSGALTGPERAEYELLLEAHPGLREFHAALADVCAEMTLATVRADDPGPSPGLKTRVLGQIAARPQQSAPHGIVMTGIDGLVRWINPAFTEMCGYLLDELRGRKLGPILQGAATDRATAERLRAAVHACEPCLETILNYHKDGHPYWVQIDLVPIRDESGQPRFLVARERELTDRALP